MPVYETVYILRPNLSANQVEQIQKNYIKLLSEELDDKAEIGRQENWGLRTIAYRMSKQRKGYYLLVNYEGAPAIVQEFERRMRLNEDVLRYLSTRLETMPSEPSAMMRNTDEDNDRPYGKRPRSPHREDSRSHENTIAASNEADAAANADEAADNTHKKPQTAETALTADDASADLKDNDATGDEQENDNG